MCCVPTIARSLNTFRFAALRALHDGRADGDQDTITWGGKGQVLLFGSGGRSKVVDVKTGDAVYIPAGFGHAIKNTGNEDLEIVQTWDNGKFEEIDVDKWVRASPNYLLANNFGGVPESTISKMKQT